MLKEINIGSTPEGVAAKKPCVFCNIVANPSQAAVILDTSLLLVIAAQEDGYPLILTKKHYKNLLDPNLPKRTSRELGEMQTRMTRIVAATENADVSVLINNGRGAGQIVDHLHVHIMSREKGKNDRRIIVPKGKTLSLKQLRSRASSYRETIKNLQEF